MSTPDIPLRLSDQLPRDSWDGVGPTEGNAGPITRSVGHRVGYFGIDVSHRQRDLNWGQAAASGKCKYAVLKIQEGATWQDPFASQHLHNATVAGVPCGAYHYARPEIDDAIKEASAFVDRYRRIEFSTQFKFKLRPWLDFEHRGTTKDCSQWVLDWYEFVNGGLGVRPIVYTYYNFAGVFDHRVQNLDLALADYRRSSKGTAAEVPPFGLPPLVHQFTGTGRIAGYDRNIDRDFAPSLEALMIKPAANGVDQDAIIRRLRSSIVQLESGIRRVSQQYADQVRETAAARKEHKRATEMAAKAASEALSLGEELTILKERHDRIANQFDQVVHQRDDALKKGNEIGRQRDRFLKERDELQTERTFVARADATLAEAYDSWFRTRIE